MFGRAAVLEVIATAKIQTRAEVSPVVAILVIVVVLAVIFGIYWLANRPKVQQAPMVSPPPPGAGPTLPGFRGPQPPAPPAVPAQKGGANQGRIAP